MTNIYDVFAEDLIDEVSKKLMDTTEMEPPEEAKFWKTAHYKEYPPDHWPEFWYIRAASLMRKLYRKPWGVNRLRKEYGGKKTGSHSHLNHSKKASGAIIRRILQQLEEQGLVEILPRKGRTLTNEGKSLMDSTASDILAKEEAEA